MFLSKSVDCQITPSQLLSSEYGTLKIESVPNQSFTLIHFICNREQMNLWSKNICFEPLRWIPSVCLTETMICPGTQPTWSKSTTTFYPWTIIPLYFIWRLGDGCVISFYITILSYAILFHHWNRCMLGRISTLTPSQHRFGDATFSSACHAPRGSTKISFSVKLFGLVWGEGAPCN